MNGYKEKVNLLKAQEEFQDSEIRYRRLFEAARDGILILDAITLEITDVNPYLIELLGYSKDDFIGKELWEIGIFADKEKNQAAFRELQDTGYIRYEDMPLETKSGVCREVEFVCNIYEEGSRQVIQCNIRDITRRKQREKELRQSEERYRVLFNSTPMAVFVCNNEAVIQTYNHQAVELWGREPERGVEKHCGSMKLWMPDGAFLPHEQSPIVKVLRTGIPALNVEVVIERPDGSHMPVIANFAPLKDAQGEITGAVTSFIDITERKRIEKERDRFFMLSVDMLCIANLNGFFERVNPAFERILGYTPEELLSSPISTFLHPADLPALMAEYASLATGGAPTTNLENRWRCKDGTYKWVAWSYFPIVEEGIAYGVGRDITKRKLSEEALRESEQRFRALVTASSDVVYRMNRDWSQMDQLEGRNFIASIEHPSRNWLEEYIHPEDQAEVRAAINEAIRTKSNFELEHRIRLVDNSFGWTHLLAIPLMNSKGEIIEWLGSASDITRRKQAVEEALQLLTLTRQAQRAAEEANRLKDEFLATLSHELRTPLNSIVGWASMMANPKFDPVNYPQAIETIRRNGQMQAQMIEDLLDVSSIVNGKLRLSKQPVDLIATIIAAVDVQRPAAAAKEISLQLELDSPAGQVFGDPDRLQQVWQNLISNAIKFTPKGGQVSVRSERIGSHVEVTVSDTGNGIGSEFLPYVFDRFRQADGSSTRGYGGLGLGLAIVRQLIELHGGTVRVESAGIGQGAIFTVSLPLAAVHIADENVGVLVQQQTTTLPEFECSPELSGIRALVVDDEADTRELLQFILERCGVGVTTANSAAAALLAIKAETFDVLISDLGMPEEDGFSLINKVRALDKEQGGLIPAAALTAYAREEDQKKALDSGFQIYVPKPIDPSELVAVVANLSERAKAQVA